MRFQCPFCRGIVAVDNSDLGIDVQCGHCQEIVTVPCSRVATGAVIADFIILQELGRGGMGIVYLAHQISLDRPAALKVLSEHYANNAEFVVGFIKEARAAAKLNHPHIVQAYAVGEDEGVFYFAMENVDGETMKGVLKREKVIPVEQALSIIQQIAEALDYAWKEQRLIHRDIKPDNIMLTSNGRAKLADLGLARVAGDIDDSEDDEVMGTPQYISPEHLTGAPMDIRSDIYSLGATFFHFVTGRFPFEGKTATEIARKHLEEPLRSPAEINPDIPETVCHIIEKMMAKTAKDRYQDAEQLVDDLRQVRRGKRPQNAASTGTGAIGRATASFGKKTIIVNRQKSGIFSTSTGPVTATGPITATGPLTGILGSTTTGLQSKSGIHGLKQMQESQARKKLIVFLAIAVIALLGAVGAMIWALKSSTKPETPQPVAVKTPEQPKKPAEPKSTPYTIKAAEIIAAAKAPEANCDQTIKACEDFFVNFPEPKYSVESEKLQELLLIYVPLDEKRLAQPREELKKARLDELGKRQKAEQAAIEAKKKKEEAEKERIRLANEKARLDKMIKDQADRNLRDYVERIETDKNHLRSRLVDVVSRKDFKSLKEVFSMALNEPSLAASKPARERELAKAHEAWARKMLESAEKAKKISDMLTDSTEMAGTQIEIKTGTLGKITEIKNGEITATLFNNKTMSVPFDQLPFKQSLNLVKKAAAKINDEDAAFLFFLESGEFVAARELSTPDAWKDEATKIIAEYIKHKVKNASTEAEKAEIVHKYGKLEEFKDAAPTLTK